MIRTLIVSTLLLCTSCIQLGGGPQQLTSYYLLESVAETSTANVPGQLRLELAPIDFPSYLDRPQLVSRNQNNIILIADHNRWAEPLPDNLTRTLKENLFKQLPGVTISSAPWKQSSDPTFRLKLIINRFDGIIGEQTDVDIRWSLVAPQKDTEILRKHFRAQLPIGDNHQGLVDGLNIALAKLSQEISAALIVQQHK